ncbi:glycosyltransferase family 2 protein [Longirhabdus pacifica]|uniref:glycosyltransferase family 2 protein n=1 Tax=Longirhabdus pacifica TaxID=2305227 RepID=UPI0010093711|nr:glycosyltransferase family 2 protein [Longirhabdus pacifica]
MREEQVIISVVIPAFNEEEVIEQCYDALTKVMRATERPYELIFVNDGSKDKTKEIITRYCHEDHHVKLINFSRNFGHQVAITAGMEHAQGEAIVVIDADLQDPPHLILSMMEKWEEGYEVVYAKRSSRKGETKFKKWTAACFYRMLSKMTEVHIPLDTGDFRLIDRKVKEVMSRMKEKNRFVRGLVSWVGFKQTAIEYEREERFAGETKYPLKKMLRLSMDAITSFSYKPLLMTVYLGFMLSGASFVYLLYVLYMRLFTDSTVTGWSSMVSINLFFFGFTFIMLGIMGQYIARIYDETRDRPLYIIDTIEHGTEADVDQVQNNINTYEKEHQHSVHTSEDAIETRH